MREELEGAWPSFFNVRAVKAGIYDEWSVTTDDTWEIVEEGTTHIDECGQAARFFRAPITTRSWSEQQAQWQDNFDKQYNNKGENNMSIVNKVKELALSKDEKALRQAGFKDSDGDWTCDSWEVIEAKLTEDHKDYLIDIAKKLNAEEDKKK